VTAWLLLGTRAHANVEIERAVGERSYRQRFVMTIAFLTFGVAVIAALARVQLGIGVAGLETPYTPYRIGTILNRLVMDVAPGLNLLVIWIADRRRLMRRSMLFTSFLVIQALIYTVASTSRGGLLRFALPLVFLWLLERRFTTRR